MFRKVIVAISGGVDSAVSAFLLKNHPRKFDVAAVFMKNWDEIDEFGQCHGEEDWEDARIVCDKLKIPLFQVNFVKEYWNEVFENFLKDYQEGITPNPDILCNRHIKFDVFFNHAMQRFKADAFATGHYARTSFGPFLENFREDEDVRLLQSPDRIKDQTFFLSQVPQKALQRTMFPVGGYLKSDVKKMAEQFGLTKVLQKDESMGVCFIGRRNFQNFIADYIDDRPGDFIDFGTGRKVGSHRGVHNWTVGQRCNLGGFVRPYFVLSKDLGSNRIYVVQGTDHPALFTDSVHTKEAYWISKPPFVGNIMRCQFRFQHTKPLVDCQVLSLENGRLFVRLSRPLRAITPGQYAVFYNGDECLGSSRIVSPGPSNLSHENVDIFEEAQKIEQTL